MFEGTARIPSSQEQNGNQQGTSSDPFSMTRPAVGQRAGQETRLERKAGNHSCRRGRSQDGKGKDAALRQVALGK